MKNRRSILKTLAALTAGLLVPSKGISSVFSPGDRIGELLPLRFLGKTGEKVTMLGLGGAHIARCDEQTAEAQIECAINGGIRFFDTAYSYGNGKSEERYGKYLVPKYREQIFLMTKSTAPDAETLLKEVDLSLRRLNTDQVDLLQIHSTAQLPLIFYLRQWRDRPV